MSLWQEKVFDILLQEEKITQAVVDNMRSWKHSGFSINNQVRIDARDKRGVRHLTEYICRCPFSLARIISINSDGKVIYRAVKKDALPYPEHGNVLFKTGMPRNFQIFKPLDFLAEITQHIPAKGAHQIRYYGQYSNKKRGLNQKKEQAVSGKAVTEKKKACMKWAQLIKMVYEVDPLICTKCGGTMKIISFIEQKEVVKRILKHCNLWKEPLEKVPKAAVLSKTEEPMFEEGVDYIPDYTVFDDIVYED